MNVLFDQNTSPRIARTLHGYVQYDGFRAIHLLDTPVSGKSDVEWIEWLGKQEGRWMFITADSRIRRNRAEREAFQNAGLKAVFLAKPYRNAKVHKQCVILLDQWPKLLDEVRLARNPVMLEMGIRRSGRFKRL